MIDEAWNPRVRRWDQTVHLESSEKDLPLAVCCTWRYDPARDEDIVEESWTGVRIGGSEMIVYDFDVESEALSDFLKDLVTRIRLKSPYL